MREDGTIVCQGWFESADGAVLDGGAGGLMVVPGADGARVLQGFRPNAILQQVITVAVVVFFANLAFDFLPPAASTGLVVLVPALVMFQLMATMRHRRKLRDAPTMDAAPIIVLEPATVRAASGPSPVRGTFSKAARFELTDGRTLLLTVSEPEFLKLKSAAGLR